MLVVFSAADARDVVAGVRRPSWDPGYPTPGDLEVAQWVLNPRFGPGDARFSPRTVVVRSSRRVIGGIGFHGAPRSDGRVEIGFGIAEGWRGRGLGSEAVRAFVAYARTLAEVRTVVAVAESSNVASAGALRAAGFVRVGEDGDRVVFEADAGAPLSPSVRDAGRP